MPIILLNIMKPILKFLTFGITLPVWVFVAVFLWFQMDKSSDIRKAVDKAVTELVNGAEIAAKNAEIAALEKVNFELGGQAEALELANKRFSENLRDAQFSLENANDEIKEIALKPVNNKCVVDSDILSVLRNK